MWWTVLLYVVWGWVGILLAMFVFVVFYLAWVHRRFAHIPAPPRDSFFLGHLSNMKAKMEKGGFFAHIMHEWMLEYGHTICLFFLHKPLVMTVDPAAVKEFLITGSYPKHIDGYEAIINLYGKHRFLGKGLVTEMDHGAWAKRRAQLNPAFHRKLLKELMTEFNQTTDDLMQKLQGQADGHTYVSLVDEMSRVSMDIIGKVAFGKNIDSIHDNQTPFPQAVALTVEGFMDDINHPFRRLLPVNLAFKRKAVAAVRMLRETGRQWMEERELAMSRGEYVVEDILSYVVQSRDKEDAESLEKCLDDLVTFFIAGQETTASLLSFLLLELGRRPEVFHKLQEEVDQVLGQKALVNYEDLGRLEYLSLLLKETLRLYPPAPATFRGCSHDTTIQGFHIPKGTGVSVNIYGSGRTPEFHPDPLDFKPERFLAHSKERPTMYTYLPFSLGPRSCIGQFFAMIEAKVIIAKFMQHFEFSLDPDQSFAVIQELSLRPKGGAMAALRLRSK